MKFLQGSRHQKQEKQGHFVVESFSQEGEDCILARIFEGRKSGFYVDVGAHHPQRFSNTYRFYQRGWRGINIDATPGSMRIFQELRHADINLEIPVSDAARELVFYIFNEPALNTFSAELAKERSLLKEYRIEKEVFVKTQRLDCILEKHLPAGQSISFLTIDVEGYDYQVLKSNDWSRFRPEFVLFEGDPFYGAFVHSEIYKFILNQGYEFIAKTVSTYFFRLV